MKYSPLLTRLISDLQVLPGVGPKSAQRIAFHLLEREREGGLRLSETLARAVDQIGHCQSCRNLTEAELCSICEDYERRLSGRLCVVEGPADVMAIEQTGVYDGRYFVLMGHLSPLDGIGPDDIGLDLLDTVLSDGNIKELILATNPTVEGEATAYYIADLARQYDVPASRIAHGVPVGGELEYVDGSTLSHALTGRQEMQK